MPKRIFIAINLPEEIKNQLVVSQKKWPTLPIRWIKKENIHITLAFLGYLDEAQLLDTLKTVEKVISLHNSFSILLNKIYLTNVTTYNSSVVFCFYVGGALIKKQLIYLFHKSLSLNYLDEGAIT